MTAPESTRALRDALRARDEARAALDDLDSRAHAFDAQSAALRESAERKRRSGTDARAAALVAGEPRPARPGDDPGAADLREADAARRAAERLRDQRPIVAARLAEAEARLTHATLAHFRAERDAAHAAALAQVGRLATFVARMMAADRVRTRLIGQQFSFDPVAHPPGELWSGAHVTQAFLRAVPERLGGAGLAAQVEADAERIAEATLSKLEAPNA